MHAHVVINTRAARFARAPRLLDLMSHVADGCTIHPTSSLDALDSACASIAEQTPPLVVLCGGDGTAMAGTTSLIEAFGDRPLPPIAFASGGNSCTIARNWGRLHNDPRRHLTELLSHARRGALRIVRRPTLRVRADDGTRTGFIFGTGLVASFFKAFYERGGGGYAEAARMIARIVTGSFVGGSLARRVLSPMPCTLRIDGRLHPSDAFTLIVSSVVRNLGLGLHVTHRAAEDPSRPHLVASSLGIVDCGLQYGRVLRGRPLLHPRTVDQVVSRFEVDFPCTGSYVLDGDLLFARRVVVEAGPGLRVASLP
jgi:diacylglycerol kinase family enzyme